ncbi:response regulator [Phenylobacterium sp. LjRoot225]|uniref:response regulator n=1 Tax=Phenylobacterium sp. LjRoot225 TaxID=3342285 RepID=UPI003ECD4556
MPDAATDTPTARVRPAPLVVLVVDDEGLREALKFSLEIEGYQVGTCRTGEQLVELELPSQAACLVIDDKLATLNGLDALEQLRQRQVTLPAILITSYAHPELHLRARRVQASVIEIPLLGDALLTRLHEILPLTQP